MTTPEQILENEHIAGYINNAIQSELRYETDNITSDGWNFLEEKCPVLIAKQIITSGDDLNAVSESDVNSILQNLITEYEQTHPNIRYYEN